MPRRGKVIALTVDHAQIAALLSQSRAAYDRKKRAAGQTDKTGKVTHEPNYPQAEDHIKDALKLRQQAHALDPEHTSPAWKADESLNRGLTHAQLCGWYEQYLKIP